MDKISFLDEESGEYIEFYVLEQTRINNMNYLLVTVDEKGDSDALILKDTSKPEDEDALYCILEDEEELRVVAGVFSELLDEEARLEL